MDPDLRKAAEAKIAFIHKTNTANSFITNSEADAQLMQILDKIDNDLSDGRKFLVGNHYSMADLVATCLLARIHFGK